jgi:hypothetical protein
MNEVGFPSNHHPKASSFCKPKKLRKESSEYVKLLSNQLSQKKYLFKLHRLNTFRKKDVEKAHNFMGKHVLTEREREMISMGH